MILVYIIVVNKDKYYSAIIVSILSVILVLVTSTLFQNQMSEAQEDSISQLLEKADSLYNEGKYQEAIIWYDKALGIDPFGLAQKRTDQVEIMDRVIDEFHARQAFEKGPEAPGLLDDDAEIQVQNFSESPLPEQI